MSYKFKKMIPSLLVTILLLLILEIVSTTVLPLMGLINYRLPFNVLIILFLGFKLETPWLSILILVLQYVHSFFSNEGWAMGTFVGTLVCVLVSYIRELIHFNTAIATMMVTEIFQLIWFLGIGLLIYIQTNNTPYVVERFWRFLPESLIVSILAPFFYSILDRVWKYESEDPLSEGR